MNIEVNDCRTCPMASHNFQFFGNMHIIRCNLYSRLGDGTSELMLRITSNEYLDPLNKYVPEGCPLKKEATLISLNK